MIEVEIKLPLYRRSLTEKALIDQGFVTGDLIRESDLYFTGESRDFIKSDEALRIRTAENLSKRNAKTYLTYKGKKLDNISMTRTELETGIEDRETGTAILKALGYLPMFEVNKLRQLYHKDSVTACVDQVENLGSFLELEIIVRDEENRPEALNKLDEILHEMGSGLQETIRISYLGMLMRKSGLFTDAE